MNRITGVSPPSCGTHGDIYYDQNTGHSYMWNGKVWAAIYTNSPSAIWEPLYIDVTTENMVQYIDKLRGI